MEKRILIIENDLEMEEIFSAIFSEPTDTVYFYEETDHIIELIEKHQPNIIILDYNLNGANGGELCKIIKKDIHHKHLPVLLLSAFPKYIYSNENVGCDAFVEKPFDVDELKMIVEEHILNGAKR
jgi:DNA-binding response OmpR family regulator